MVDAIIRLTTMLVVVMVVINLGYAGMLAVRLARRIRQQHPDRWVWLLLPTWRSPREALAWFSAWCAILCSTDPLVASVRADGRSMIVRHAQLFAWTETWAMLVIFMAPYAA
jgi:hypothetical protein